MSARPTTVGLEAGWKTKAACAGISFPLFFPNPETPLSQVEKAKAVCASCPVAEECLEYALETNQVSGIWGGTTEDERKSLRRKWLAARRRSA